VQWAVTDAVGLIRFLAQALVAVLHVIGVVALQKSLL